MLQFRLSLSFFLLLVVFSACKNDKAAGPEETKPSTSTAPAAAPDETNESATTPAGNIRYTWVDQLNVRDQPNTKGKVVARVKPNEPLTLTGETSPESETIVLRGVAYHEPWFRITTADKKDGWVFGGAVKKEDEMKGNGVMREDELDFPIFGVFKLSEWEKLPSESGEVGDAEYERDRYRAPNGQVLEIDLTDLGEYGYTNSYSLKDAKGNLLKERNLNLSVDVEMRLLTETVTDHTDIPAKRYVRTQEIMSRNVEPQMASGAWTTERID